MYNKTLVGNIVLGGYFFINSKFVVDTITTKHRMVFLLTTLDNTQYFHN